MNPLTGQPVLSALPLHVVANMSQANRAEQDNF